MERLRLLASHIQAQGDNTSLKGKTVVITGASRGIGLAIAVRCARDGANIAILAKTAQPHPKLPGTIYTAADEITRAGGVALPLPCDIRSEEQVKRSIQKVVETFGRIDILVNNASALDWSGTIGQSMKKFDLMHEVIVRGTFLVSKQCLPHLLKATNTHILNICAPPNHYPLKALSDKTAYSLMKSGATMLTALMAEEFRWKGVSVNGLWPKKTIATAVINNLLGGEEVMRRARRPEIMADAAHFILTSKDEDQTGIFFVDEELLSQKGVTQFGRYETLNRNRCQKD